MSKNYKAKTEGLDLLAYSMKGFNANGYADRYSPQAFVNSYLAWNEMKGRQTQLELVDQYPDYALEMAETLLQGLPGGNRPSKKGMEKFLNYYSYE